MGIAWILYASYFFGDCCYFIYMKEFFEEMGFAI
jgi:hypothetical protein